MSYAPRSMHEMFVHTISSFRPCFSRWNIV